MTSSRLRIGQLVDDLRKGTEDEEIREKYGLAQDILEKIKDALVQRGLLPKDKRQSRQTPCAVEQSNTQKSIDAKQFLLSFRQNPDDVHLMKEHSLKPAQLKLIYELLIQKGLLSEYEYRHRAIKVPELEEPTENPLLISNQVNLIEDVSDATRRSYSLERSSRISSSASDSSIRKQPTAPRLSVHLHPQRTFTAE